MGCLSGLIWCDIGLSYDLGVSYDVGLSYDVALHGLPVVRYMGDWYPDCGAYVGADRWPCPECHTCWWNTICGQAILIHIYPLLNTDTYSSNLLVCSFVYWGIKGKPQMITRTWTEDAKQRRKYQESHRLSDTTVTSPPPPEKKVAEVYFNRCH